ncbi:hypothetical protein SBA4_2080004 [Candidatus Sulfopaludibacter sp. SbA4]|nr:hypothetical protein SBA4_2080004 [Candidatus Sulfopaludibacter sp. SbA4]
MLLPESGCLQTRLGIGQIWHLVRETQPVQKALRRRWGEM